MHVKRLIAAVALMFLISTPTYVAWGEPGAGAPNGGRGHGKHMRPEHLTPEQRAEALTKIKALRVYQLTEILQLEESKSSAFFSKLSRFDDEVAKLRENQMKASRELRRAVAQEQKGEVVSPETYTALLKQMQEGELATMEVRRQFMEDAGEILNPGQMARFALYQMEFERRLRRYIQKAARGGGGLDGLNSPKGLTGE